MYPNGMEDLVIKKKRVASAKARFCTGELKIKPMINFMNEPLQSDVKVIYTGIRRDESEKRANAKIREYADLYDCWMVNPIVTWTASDVFLLHKRYGIKPNPLYKKGASRVGCFPCVMINHGELKRMQDFYPFVWDKIEHLEKLTGRSFFPPNYIPKRFQTGFDPKTGKCFPTAQDIKKYVMSPTKAGQLSFLEPQTCSSIYNLCE